MLSSLAKVDTRPTLSSISAIIPAYNEKGRIGKVLAVLRQVECLSEILVVDDGSTDQTGEEAQREVGSDPRFRLIRLDKNLGKGQALFTGWQHARSNYLLLLDADLIGLTPLHIIALMQPVLEGRADMTLGLFRGGYWRTDLSHILTPWLSGQRCLRAELFRYISPKAAAGYGFETALTVAAQQHHWRCQAVILRGVSHVPSENHRGLWRGLATRSKMYAHIVRAWFQAEGWRHAISQFPLHLPFG
ncbi:MAG: glycosyltransferase family 2 protein [Candidatus Methanomethyliaceae archaeon]